MAGRVNTKFVFILASVLILLVGAIVVVSQLASRDARELVARGEQYLAEGEYELAAETMQRAIGRSKSNPDIIRRYVEVVKQIPAADQIEANNTMQIVRQWTLNLAQIDPSSEQYLQDYADLIGYYIDRLRTGGGLHPFLRYTHQAAVARLETMQGDKLARRLRGINGLPLLNVEMTEEDIETVRDDLMWARGEYPNDPDIAINVARWNLFEANRLDRPGGDAEQAAALREEALQLSQALVDAAPDDIVPLVDHLQVLYQSSRRDADPDDPYAAIKPLVDEIEARLLEDPKPFRAVATTIEYVKSVYAKDLVAEEAEAVGGRTGVEQNQGTQRALALLERAVADHPDDPRYNLMLGIELKNLGRFDDSRAYLEKVKGLSTQGEYLEVLLNASLKSLAEVEYADLLISLAQLTDDEEQREAMYAEAEQIIDQLTSAGQGEAPRILLMKGRLALSQQKIREGLISIDKAAEKYDAFSRQKAEALLLSARARAQQGDWGAAAERYEQLLQANPNIPAVRLTLASIYTRQRQFDAAQDHLDAILLDDPENERALIVQASVYAAQDDLDKTIEIYRGLGLPNRPDLALSLSQLMIQGGREAQAAKMLRYYFDADPGNLNLLTGLLRAVDDPEQQRQLIAQARAGGGNPETLAVFEQQLSSQVAGDLDKTIEIALEGQTDPFLREMGTAQLYARAGDDEKSRAALARAAELKPEEKVVIDMQFGYALRDNDLDLAQQLADKAAQKNLDEAGGRFYFAQVRRARGDFAGGIEVIREALEMVPINSDGWRLLGDMHVADNNDQEAVEAYEKSLRQKPDNLGAIRGLAAIRDRQGRNDEALAMLRDAQAQYANNKPLEELYLSYEGRYGDKQEALRRRRGLQTQEPDNLNNRRALAILLAETGKADEGEQMLRGVIESEGRTATNVLALASVQRLAGRLQQGAQTIRTYIQSRGAEAGVGDHLLLARYLLQIQDGKGAFDAYQQAIAAESEQREASRELASLLFSRGSYDRAKPLYVDLYEKFPGEVPLGLRLADAMIRTGEYEEAAAVLDTLEGGPTEDALAALIAEQRGDHEQALTLINRAIEAEPGRAVFFYERAVLNAQTPDLNDEVIQDLNTALSHDPGHLLSRRLLVAMYQRRGERNEAIRELTTMVNRHPTYNEGRLMLVQMYAQDGNLTRAKALTRQALESNDEQPAWHSVMGDLALREEDTDAAIASYLRVFELNRTPGELLKVATLQLENGREADAQALLRENADLVNPQPLLQSVMGRALHASGKADEARQVFSRAAERCTNLGQLFGVVLQIRKDYTLEETAGLLAGLNQPPSQVWIDLSLARLELADGLAEQAYSRLTSVESSLSAEDAAERLSLDEVMAPALHAMGRVDEALTYYRRLEEAMPDNGTVLNNMAYLLTVDLDKPEEALPLAKRAVELQPRNAQVLDTLGWIQFKLGDVEEARRMLEASIAVQGLAANHLHLAELLIDQGYRAEAQRHLQTAIDLAEQDKDTDSLERARELLEQADELTEAS